MIFVTIKTNIPGVNYAYQNKVALRCDIEKENIHEVAKTFFNDICMMDELNPDYYEYEIFIKNNGSFFKIVKEIPIDNLW
jgi:hypothetical protein